MTIKPFTYDRTVHPRDLKVLGLSRPGAKFPGLKSPDSKCLGGKHLGPKRPGPNIQIRIFRVLSVGCEMSGFKMSKGEACTFQTSSCEMYGSETSRCMNPSFKCPDAKRPCPKCPVKVHVRNDGVQKVR